MTLRENNRISEDEFLSRNFTVEGVSYCPKPTSTFAEKNWFDHAETFGPDAEHVSYLSQLEEEGFAQFEQGTVFLSWDTIYQLLDLSEHVGSVALLGLPELFHVAPNLKSSGGLTDTSFSIAIAGWRHKDGSALSGQLKTVGAIAERNGQQHLLPEPSWRLVHAIKTYAALPATEKKPDVNRRHWAQIRKFALAARASLDNFLSRTIVLTPEKLRMTMRKIQFGDTKVVEVIPEFSGAPSGWLKAFDGYNHVQDRYDISDGAGQIQILIEPAVKTVLSEIKRMPGRRVSGSRAEAFIRNPFALLGEEAGQVISEDEFEEAREEAGIYFNRFTANVDRDEKGISGVSLLIECSQKGAITTERYPFKNPEDLGDFIHELDQKLSQSMQCCAWEGWDLELLGDAKDQLCTLRDARAEWSSSTSLGSLSDVYDLSRYSQRIAEIGKEKPYYSPYIGKTKDDEGWFPDNAAIGYFWKPEGSSEPLAIRLDPKDLDKIETDIAKAKTDGKDQLQLPNCPKPMSLPEAEALIGTLRETFADVKAGTFPKAPKSEPSGTKSTKPLTLVLKPNIERVDYEERRQDLIPKDPDFAPQLPQALKPEMKLLDHQLKGIARLQHLWNNPSSFCRGALMADDMGLGKTVQLLTFVVNCLEEHPDLEPVLIVAPVSLLENWNAEIVKFFKPEALKVETLYGDRLATKKLRRDQIPEDLLAKGLTRFLRPGWRGDANCVLTTYETLRDLEFSLASESWSIMICDEAQKIKNANALVTRAAKKQNVRFKIACTGTPVENSLADLWCLFDFIQPGLLGALNEFGTHYRRPIEAKTDEERARVEQLREHIEPQLIRRTKGEVAKDLPKKHIVDSCKSLPMSPYQRTLYSHLIGLFKSQLSENGKENPTNHLQLLYHLKRVCIDPRPLGQQAHTSDLFEDYANKSPKMRWLMAELENIHASNEKAIIFIEFRDIQRIIQNYVRLKFGIAPDIINGDTTVLSKNASSRQKRIDAFQKIPGFGVIILSPLAVGFGVNIQTANHVIHYTRSWNPAKEDQATDRAHRIGQKKDVHVYCPTIIDSTFKTFEKKLDELLEWKRNLSEDMLNGAGNLSGAEFGEIEDVDGAPVLENRPVTIEDVMQMNPETFEAFCAALWQKQGYPNVYLTPKSGDGGVDVVVIKNKAGALIQAKSSLNEGKELGWEGVKEVVAGEAAYKAKHPGVTFTKYSVTNQFFNDAAQHQAEVNNVTLVDQEELQKLLKQNLVTRLDLEQYLAQLQNCVS